MRVCIRSVQHLTHYDVWRMDVVKRCYLSHNSYALRHTSIECDALLMCNYAAIIASSKTVLKLNRRDLARQLRPFWRFYLSICS